MNAPATPDLPGELDPEFQAEAARDRQVTALRRRFQEIININLARGADSTADRTVTFSIDGAAYYTVTPAQWRELLALAPPDIAALNAGQPGDPDVRTADCEAAAVNMVRAAGYAEQSARHAVSQARRDGSSTLVTLRPGQPDVTRHVLYRPGMLWSANGWVLRPARPGYDDRPPGVQAASPQPPVPGTLGGMRAEQAVIELRRLGHSETAAEHAVQVAGSPGQGYRYVIGEHRVSRPGGDGGFRIEPWRPAGAPPDPGRPHECLDVPLTREQAQAMLIRLGYTARAVRKALDHAGERPWPPDGASLLAAHQVTADASGSTYTITARTPVLPSWRGTSDDNAVTELTRLGYGQEEAGYAVARAMDAGQHALRDHVVTAFLNPRGPAFAIYRSIPVTELPAACNCPCHGDTKSAICGTCCDPAGPDDMRAPWPDLTRDYDVAEILAAVAVIDAHLDAAAPAIYRDDHPASRLANMWRRMCWPMIEAAEVPDALAGHTGANPRKGICATPEDMVEEAADTVVSALCAIQSQTKDIRATWAVFIASLAKILARVPSGRPDPAAGQEEPS